MRTALLATAMIFALFGLMVTVYLHGVAPCRTLVDVGPCVQGMDLPACSQCSIVLEIEPDASPMVREEARAW